MAQPYRDIRMDLQSGRRFFGVHVSKSADHFIGIHFEVRSASWFTNQNWVPHGGVLLVDFGAFTALAIVVIIHLREVVLARIGHFLHALQHLLGDNIQDLRVGQAELRFLASAYAAYLGKVLGVLLEVLIGGYESKIAVTTAIMRVLDTKGTVRSSFAVIFACAGLKSLITTRPCVAGVAPEEGRFLQQVQCGKGNIVHLRRIRFAGSVPANPQMVLKKIIHAIECARSLCAGDNQVRSDGPDKVSCSPRELSGPVIPKS